MEGGSKGYQGAFDIKTQWQELPDWLKDQPRRSVGLELRGEGGMMRLEKGP